MKKYPKIFKDNFTEILQRVVEYRDQDVNEFNSLSQNRLKGRRTARIPSSNSDVVAGDQLYDVTNDGTYEYILIDIGSSTLRWDRRAIDVAW